MRILCTVRRLVRDAARITTSAMNIHTTTVSNAIVSLTRMMRNAAEDVVPKNQQKKTELQAALIRTIPFEQMI